MIRAHRMIARVLPLIAIVALLGTAEPALAGKGSLQTDALIKGGPADTTYAGDGIYNDNAVDQTKTRIVRPGSADLFSVRLENDGTGFNPLMISGDGNSPGFRVNYFADGTDITSSVVAGTYETDCMEDTDFRLLTVKIKATKNTAIGSSNTVMVTATPEIGCGNAPEGAGTSAEDDTVAARVIVKRNAGDEDGLQPRR